MTGGRFSFRFSFGLEQEALLIPAGRPLPAMPAIVRLRRPARVDDAIDRTARRVGLLGRRRRAVAALKLSCLTLSTPP